MKPGHVWQRHGRRVALVVVDSNAPRFSPEVHGGTWKRSECPTQRPCPRIFCRANLLHIPATERAGRKGLRHVPRNERGLTVSDGRAFPDDRRGTIDPRYLTDPDVTSCMWDVVEAANGPLVPEQIGVALGRHRTLIGRLVERALLKLKRLGVSANDIELLIDRDHAMAEHREPSRGRRQ